MLCVLALCLCLLQCGFNVSSLCTHKEVSYLSTSYSLTRSYRASISRVIYLGLFIPLQLLFCGSLIYLSTYPTWLRWGAYINPMHFYLAAVFVNEFHQNSATFASTSSHRYDDLKSQYGYRTSLFQSIFLLVVLGYFYKMLWLFSLKYREIWSVGTLPLKRVFRAAKKKMKKLMKASLRFSKKFDDSTDDGYVLDNSSESFEWRSDDDKEEDEQEQKEKKFSKENRKKQRQSLNEEMLVREDGLLLFGVMQQPTTSTSSHHSVLSALYRPEYIQTSSPSSSMSISSPTSATGAATSSPNASNRTGMQTASKNRIVVSKSQRGANGSSTGGGGGQEGAIDNMHSSLRI